MNANEFVGDRRMRLVNKLLKWWKKQNDPLEKLRREEFKKAEKMGKLLERNKQVDQQDSMQ